MIRLPRSHHDDVLCRLEVQQLVEDIVSTRDDNGRVRLQVRCKLLVEYTWLNLVRDQQEQHCARGQIDYPGTGRARHTISYGGSLREFMFNDEPF